jgi:general secretion pathway protein J
MRRLTFGFTMVEVLVAVGLLSMLSSIIFGATSVILRSQRIVMDSQERYHAGRVAIMRLTGDLSQAFLSKHAGLLERNTETLFRGEEDEVLFCYLGHKRIFPKGPESDQGVVSYSLERAKKGGGKNLVRREKPHIDERADRGGRNETLAENVKSLKFEYWDKEQEDWTSSWEAVLEDTEQVAVDQVAQDQARAAAKLLTGTEVEDTFVLPRRIKVTLVLEDEAGKEYSFVSQVELRLTEAFQW